ncbi:MAG TPA: AmmeMemoRadiSam system protein B [Terriglobales bacterium]|nr:AmmeMemoRadiSam system protein B [Terriglobales bacterium]
MDRGGKSKPLLLLAAGLVAGALLLVPSSLRPADKEEVRQPAVAGNFYPADPKELERTIDGLLASAGAPTTQEPVVALIAPHAGYQYSGPVAAHSYALLKGRKFERVVVIAPSHFEAFDFTSVYEGDSYVTPLGAIPVDKAFAAKLASLAPGIRLSQRGHTPAGPQGEHALEVQLPFLQRTLGQFKLVPIVMGDQSWESSRALGVALAKLIPGTDTLIVASSDLTHYRSADEVSRIDHHTLQAIEDWDTLSLSRNFQSGVWEACGGAPIVAAMIAAQRLGANQAKVLKYANTGDVTGDRSRVVGYGAVALLRVPRSGSTTEVRFSLSDRDKEELLRIARLSAETAVRTRKLYEPPVPASAALLQERGAFVTLREKGELRGCIGYVSAVKPLYLTVRDVAALAALRDSRFPPVTPGELGLLEYEVSVISPFHQVLDVRQIKVGRDGLMILKGGQDGILLPQVARDENWDRNTFLEQVGVKAGLPPRTWKDEDADLFAFTALVFAEPKAPEAFTPQPPFPGRPEQPTPPGRDSTPR